MSRAGPGAEGLLDLWEPGWRLGFADVDTATTAWLSEVEEAEWRGAAADLGAAAQRHGTEQVARRWPACLLVAAARCHATARPGVGAQQGFRTAWHRACGVRKSVIASAQWESALLLAGRILDLPSAAAAAAAAAEGADEDSVADLLARLTDSPVHEHGETVRLDPYGSGVVRGVGFDADPAGPQESAAETGDTRMLVFDDSGRLLPGDLPPDAVWVVHPADAELTADRELRVLVVSRMPLSWHGWRLVQVDLAPVSWLGVAGAAPRRVRGAARPRLEHPAPPVPGLRTQGGLPLYAEPPSVRLPPGSGIRWRIELRRAGGPVLAARWAQGTQGTLGTQATQATQDPVTDLWSKLPRPLLGEYTVTVSPQASGADGAVSGLRRTVAIVQGLNLRCSPALRLTTESGIEPGEALLGADAGLTLSPVAAELGPHRAETVVRAVAGPTVLVLRVSPPHLRMWVEPQPGTGQPPSARATQLARSHWQGPVRLDHADLARGGSLRLDLPAHPRGQDGYPPISVLANGIEVQVLEPSKVGRYPLRRLLDTAVSHAAEGRGLRLTARIDGRPALIALIEPLETAADPWAPERRIG